MIRDIIFSYKGTSGALGFGEGESIKMLQLGSLVVYGIHGVCVIADIEQRTIDRKNVEYFVLTPKDQPQARFYVPTQNQVALSKLLPLLTREDLEALFASEDTYKEYWIPNENLRKQRYKEMINGSDRAMLISMIQTLHKHKESQLAAGRKFHLCDENFLRDAQKRLASEFSVVLGIPQAEVADYIASKLQK